MSLEQLLRSNLIRKIKPDQNLALNALKRASRDINTAKTLMANKRFDWSLAVAYNAMLSAGRALMFQRGFRPSSTEGHVAVVRFLQATLGTEAGSKMILRMNRMRKKRHRIIYEEMDIVSKDEAKQMIEWAEKFVEKISNLITLKKSKVSKFGASKGVGPFTAKDELKAHD